MGVVVSVISSCAEAICELCRVIAVAVVGIAEGFAGVGILLGCAVGYLYDKLVEKLAAAIARLLLQTKEFVKRQSRRLKKACQNLKAKAFPPPRQLYRHELTGTPPVSILTTSASCHSSSPSSSAASVASPAAPGAPRRKLVFAVRYASRADEELHIKLQRRRYNRGF